MKSTSFTALIVISIITIIGIVYQTLTEYRTGISTVFILTFISLPLHVNSIKKNTILIYNVYQIKNHKFLIEIYDKSFPDSIATTTGISVDLYSYG